MTTQTAESEPQPACFTDLTGRTWVLKLTVGTLMRVKTECGVDLLKLIEPESPVFDQLRDVYTLTGVLWVVLDQAAKGELTIDQFAEALAGDVLGDAVEALLGALVNFFPDARRRQVLRSYWETTKSLEGRVLEIAQAKLDSAVQQLGGISGGGQAPAA